MSDTSTRRQRAADLYYCADPDCPGSIRPASEMPHRSPCGRGSLALLPRPKLKLTGTDGNAFGILGRFRRALVGAGWSPAQVTQAFEEASRGDYDHLLQTVMKYADVR